MTKDRKARVAAVARSRGDRAAEIIISARNGLFVNDQELTQFQETGEANIYVGVPTFANAIVARDCIADTLGLRREDIIPIGLEDDTPIVGFRVAAA